MEPTNISADPESKKIGFFVQEWLGSPVFLVPDPMPTQEKWDVHWRNSSNWLTKETDLYPGLEILVSSLIGWVKVTVHAENGSLYAKSERFRYSLTFNQDARHCWVCVGSYNAEASKNWSFLGEP